MEFCYFPLLNSNLQVISLWPAHIVCCPIIWLSLSIGYHFNLFYYNNPINGFVILVGQLSSSHVPQNTLSFLIHSFCKNNNQTNWPISYYNLHPISIFRHLDAPKNDHPTSVTQLPKLSQGTSLIEIKRHVPYCAHTYTTHSTQLSANYNKTSPWIQIMRVIVARAAYE